jgi:membrane associated rhomboid family serine protease
MSYSGHNGSSFAFDRPRVTWAVQRLILANILIFAAQQLWAPLEIYAVLRFNLAPNWLDAFFSFQPTLFLQGHLWTPFTYQFLHGGLMHLFMNMLWLFFAGIYVERALGTRKFLQFYLFCGAAGVMATYAPLLAGAFLQGTPVYSMTPVLGASGAVMGVLIAFAFTDPNREFFLFPLPVPINARILVLFIVLMNLVTALGGKGGVSVSTHFGGMIAGFCYMKLAPKYNAWRRRVKPKPAKKKKDDSVGEAVDNIFKFKNPRR